MEENNSEILETEYEDGTIVTGTRGSTGDGDGESGSGSAIAGGDDSGKPIEQGNNTYGSIINVSYEWHNKTFNPALLSMTVNNTQLNPPTMSSYLASFTYETTLNNVTSYEITLTYALNKTISITYNITKI